MIVRQKDLRAGVIVRVLGYSGNGQLRTVVEYRVVSWVGTMSAPTGFLAQPLVVANLKRDGSVNFTKRLDNVLSHEVVSAADVEAVWVPDNNQDTGELYSKKELGFWQTFVD